MRLWSLHPKYLDRQGLLAVWRESLLAQKVLQGGTTGYRRHPQLTRFRRCSDPLAAIATYLAALADEADDRHYSFDRSKIGAAHLTSRLKVNRGQVLFEWQHLKAKLSNRDPSRYAQIKDIARPDLHPLFELIEGDLEEWEKRSTND